MNAPPPPPANRRHLAVALAALGVWAGLASALAGTSTLVHTDGVGRVAAMSLSGEWIEVSTDVIVALPGWSRTPGLDPWSVSDVHFSQEGNKRTWTGQIAVADGISCAYRQTLTEATSSASLDIAVTAGSDFDSEGVYLFVKVPIKRFAGAPCLLEAEGKSVGLRGKAMPKTLEKECRFLTGTGSRVLLGDPESLRLEIGLDKARDVTVQDEREWQGDRYAFFTRLSNGPMKKGETATVSFTIAFTGNVPHTRASLAVKPDEKLFTLDGFGGNFVYGIESPVCQYMLDNLRTGWARTQMSLSAWEPQNDNASPDAMNWLAFEAQDRSGSSLRREFELAKDLQRRGIPWCISVWDLPEWLYTDPGKGPGTDGRRVAPEKWPELLEAIGAYLLYAKRQYAAEPELFSFNEPDLGIRVLLSAEEHRDAVKQIGAYLRKLGLKTRMLLADAATPRGSEAYALPATRDPEAMRQVGALAFHSWGGGTPAEYGAWAKLAAALKLPLLVTETGVDPSAWRAPWQIKTFYYAIQELRLYQELLLYARPQALMQWEFTTDYGCVEMQKIPTGSEIPRPTWRFAFLQHFCNLTPPKATALATTSDQTNVLFTAFTGEVNGQSVHTFHIANLGTSRVAEITGLPRDVSRLRAVRTAEDELFRELAPVEAANGELKVMLTDQSFLTLTTMPREDETK